MTKQGSELISFWLPRPIAGQLDEAVKAADTDRSKFIRAAVRERLSLKKLKVAGAQ